MRLIKVSAAAMAAIVVLGIGSLFAPVVNLQGQTAPRPSVVGPLTVMGDLTLTNGGTCTGCGGGSAILATVSVPQLAVGILQTAGTFGFDFPGGGRNIGYRQSAQSGPVQVEASGNVVTNSLMRVYALPAGGTTVDLNTTIFVSDLAGTNSVVVQCSGATRTTGGTQSCGNWSSISPPVGTDLTTGTGTVVSTAGGTFFVFVYWDVEID